MVTTRTVSGQGGGRGIGRSCSHWLVEEVAQIAMEATELKLGWLLQKL